MMTLSFEQYISDVKGSGCGTPVDSDLVQRLHRSGSDGSRA